MYFWIVYRNAQITKHLQYPHLHERSHQILRYDLLLLFFPISGEFAGMDCSLILCFKVTKSIISLLHYYGWRKFSIIHEELWTTVAKSLENEAKSKQMTINHNEQVIDNHKCCENDMQCCRSGYWYQVFKEFIDYNLWMFDWICSQMAMATIARMCVGGVGCGCAGVDDCIYVASSELFHELLIVCFHSWKWKHMILSLF